MADSAKNGGQEIVSFRTADGVQREFRVLDRMVYGTEFYAFMQSVERPEWMGENEFMIFRLIDTPGKISFDLVTDDALNQEIFAEYVRRLQEKNGR